MKRIFFTLVSSFLFLVAAKAQFATLTPDPTNSSSPLIIGVKYHFIYTYSGGVFSNASQVSATGNSATVGQPANVISQPGGNKIAFDFTPLSNGSTVITINADNSPGCTGGTTGTCNNKATSDLLINATVAIELSDFSAKSVASSKVNINWTTASEKDNSMFKVETSTNGVSFTAVGEVKGMGTSAIAHEYTYTDNNSYNAAVVYYRLKAVDFSGTESVSKVVSVITGNKGKLSLDVVNTSGNVIFASPSNEKLTLSIYSTSGQVVYSSDVTAFQGANNISANFANLNTGLYIARLSSSTDASTMKFFKN